ncbi:MAG: aldolase [Clostridia bacterium]|nr:aldolase [Clostridia bacterium]
MPLKLMYITNQPEVAQVVEHAGVDRVFVDMEYIGKSARQGGMDTVQSHHTVEDVAAVRAVLKKSELLVRINPVHAAEDGHMGTAVEVERVIAAGADVLMLPYFKTVEEVQTFLQCVNGRAKTMLLVETKEAVEHLDEILGLPGIDEVHIGMNDLSISYGKKFMFELLSDGTVERLCDRIRRAGITAYGFGGIASLGKGLLPAEMIICEHYRLGSSIAILSRSFCNVNQIDDLEELKRVFETGVADIRGFERRCTTCCDLAENRQKLAEKVTEIVSTL